MPAIRETIARRGRADRSVPRTRFERTGIRDRYVALGETEADGPAPLESMIALDGLVIALVVGAIAASAFGATWVLAFVAAALAAAVARIVVTVAGGRSLLDGLRSERRVDPLTGLGNRRALIEHIEQQLSGSGRHPSMLAVFSLDGLRHYEETYGGMASDAMVRRLGRRLFDVAVDGAHAFRPAGERFAIVQPVGRVGFGAMLAAATAALSDDGDGFRIDALAGLVLLPEDAPTAEQALLRADQRLMAQREARSAVVPPSLRQLVADAVARRREPLTAGGPSIGELARSVAGRLGLSLDESARAAMASELYAVGRLALPREVLAQPGLVGQVEWEFIEHEAIVGERIIAIAIDAPDVGAVVRASHEHFDGTGHPDGLAGDEIPVEARIVAVCVAFEQMLTPGPQHPPRGAVGALSELSQGAGTQFDPAIVAAFSETVTASRDGEAVREGHLASPTPVDN